MSEVEKLPESWVITELGNYAWVRNGFAFKSNLFIEKSNTSEPIIRISNIKNNEVNSSNSMHYESENIPEGYAIESGDLLIAMSGATTGKVGVYLGELAHQNQRVGNIKLLSEKYGSKKYLGYLLETLSSEIQKKAHGAAQPNISSKAIESFLVALAPHLEQERIVEKLDELFSELDAGVKELKSAKIKLAQYRQSLLKSAVEGSLTQKWREANSDSIQETGEQLLVRILKQRREHWEQQKREEFKAKGQKPQKDWQDKYPEPVKPDTTDLPELPKGWVWASLDMIIDNIEAGKSFKCLERPPTDEEYGVVKVSAVSWGEYNELESKTCTRSDLKNDKILIKEGDFLFSRANTTELVGACVIAKQVTKTVMLSDKILRIRFIEERLKFWILQFMRGEFGRTQIEYAATGNQASMKNVSQGKLVKFVVPLPPLKEVAEVYSNLVIAFENITNSASEAEMTMKFLDAQRKNILKSAFSGQLVPQDPNDEPASVLLAKIKQEREVLLNSAKAKLPRKPKTNKPALANE